MELVEKSFDELSERAQQDQEEAARVWKKWDELLQRDAETRQRIINLLAEAKREQDLRLVVEERSMALEQRVKLDAETVSRLRTERDEPCHTAERLCLEHGGAYGECIRAIRERDEVQQRISSL